MFKKVKNDVNRFNLITTGDAIVVGVSGGADSMALLYILHMLCQEKQEKLYIAHINHGIRGEEANKDEALVKNYCTHLGLHCDVLKVKVEQLAKENGAGVEEMGRVVRYQFFDELTNKYAANKIAVAHHQDDQVETVLHHFIRGAGMQGLCGMEPLRKPNVIRPLLFISKKEILDFCQANKIPYRIDETNNQTEYTRNALRLDLIPFIENKFNPNFKNGVAQMVQVLQDEEQCLQELTMQAYCGVATVENHQVTVNLKQMKGLAKAIQRRIFRKAIEEVKGNTINIERIHIEIMIDLLEKGETGNELQLPMGISVFRDSSSVVITKKKYDSVSIQTQTIKVPGDTVLSEIDRVITSRWVLKEEINFHPTRAYIDTDKIQDNLIVRNRKNGDRIIPIGMGNSKKVKDILIDLKIPKRERHLYPVLCDGEEIVWIIGQKLSEKYKVTKKSQNIIEFCVKIVDNL